MEKEPLEINLNQKQCAEVALYMFEEYKKEMTQPQFSIPTFSEWLQKLIKKNDNKK